jgi:hypothetical protein
MAPIRVEIGAMRLEMGPAHRELAPPRGTFTSLKPTSAWRVGISRLDLANLPQLSQRKTAPNCFAAAVGHAQRIAIYWALRNGTPYPEQVQRMEQDRREAQIRYHLQQLTKLEYQA